MGRSPEPIGRRPEPIGVILAGGRGRRLGGAKAIVELRGRPLISYPWQALRAVLTEVAIVAKAETELPSLPGATVWTEPDTPRHPLVGIIHALGLAAGRPVVVCAGDLPFVTPTLIERLAGAESAGSPTVLAAGRGVVQPLLGCYRPGAADLLAGAFAAVARGDALPRMQKVVAGLGPRLLAVEDLDELFNVNSPADLLEAEAMLASRAENA